jgi:transposase
MADSERDRDKRETLRRRGVWNRHPERVRDDLFERHEFFDPEDLVQVKYEMLRRVRVDGEPIQRAAEDFGLSRPSFYAARERFDEDGLAGLLPHKPGPKGGHKLTEQVVDFLEEVLAREPATSSEELAARLRETFGLETHPRSIERALERRRKKNSGRGR